jgi:hypothetical protein
VSDDNFDFERWLAAIMAADTWRDPRARGPKRVGDLRPLAALFRSGSPPPPRARELLADLLSRHRLMSTTTRTPSYTTSESEIDAQVLAEFVDEFRRQPRWPHGPITKAEMNEAVEVLQRRARAKRRGHVKFEGRAAATQLRQERLHAFADYYFFDRYEFERAVLGKTGSINRLQRKQRA